MGIKGLFQELEEPKRVSLSKLAAEHYERTGRKFRLAIDYSIWQFQSKAALGGGGHNPTLRTLYYRLLRLVKIGIHACFVYDGPGRPKFKRNKTIETSAFLYQTKHEKELISLFNFDIIVAPGEAEAQCAAMQQRGLVDAVLTEDGDALMFGSTLMLSNWSSSRPGSKIPTHVNIYERKAGDHCKALSSQDLVLVALLSGGDYRPEGVIGCGIKLAIEAARAGFGKDLAVAFQDSPEAVKLWRERLQREFATNESSFFSRRHPSIRIPAGFPEKTLYAQYAKPIVFDEITLPARLAGSIDLIRIAEFAKLHFGRTFSSRNDLNHLLDALVTDNLLCWINPNGARNPKSGGLHFLKILKEGMRPEDDGYSSYQILIDVTQCLILCSSISLELQDPTSDNLRPVPTEQTVPSRDVLRRNESESAADEDAQIPETVTKIWVPCGYVQKARPDMVQDFQRECTRNRDLPSKGRTRKPKIDRQANRSIKDYFPIVKATATGEAAQQLSQEQTQLADINHESQAKAKHNHNPRVAGTATGEYYLVTETSSTIMKNVLTQSLTDDDGSRNAGGTGHHYLQANRNAMNRPIKGGRPDNRHVNLRRSLAGSWSYREELICDELSRLPSTLDSVLCLAA